MTKTMEMMKATKKLKGFEENSSLLFDYVWTCENLKMVLMMRIIENSY